MSCLFDGEVRAADALLSGARVFGFDEFEVERQSPVRRQRPSHREQIGRDVDATRERDEVCRVRQRRVETFGVALRTQERLALAFYVAAANRQKTRSIVKPALLKAKYCPRAVPVQHFVNPGQLHVTGTQPRRWRHRANAFVVFFRIHRLFHGSSLLGPLPPHKNKL